MIGHSYQDLSPTLQQEFYSAPGQVYKKYWALPTALWVFQKPYCFFRPVRNHPRVEKWEEGGPSAPQLDQSAPFFFANLLKL